MQEELKKSNSGQKNKAPHACSLDDDGKTILVIHQLPRRRRAPKTPFGQVPPDVPAPDAAAVAMHPQDRLKLLTSPAPTLSSSSSGLPPPATHKSCMSAAAKRWKYLRRMLLFRQMDFEVAFWQMFYLMARPKVVYRDFR